MLRLVAPFFPPFPPAERSLLLCFQSSLPLFERLLLPALQQEGAGAVSLLVDHTDYEQSCAEASAVSRVAVDYAYDSVRLPGPAAALHAKLYLLLRRDGARLLVSSANLTPSGIGQNLEVVDVLELRAAGVGDATAFRAYVELLDALPSLVPTLRPNTQKNLTQVATDIRKLLGRAPAFVADEPLLLHTANTSLLDQVTSLVPAAEVTEIVAVSPFYDRENRALLALAAAYPGARIRVLKDRLASGEFNGVALAPLGDRVRVERITIVARRIRRLHAKAMMFLGPRQAWLLTGSANLTAPAWLVPARLGGNLEAVTLRSAIARKGESASDLAGIPRLLGALETVEVPHTGLTVAVTDSPAPTVSGLTMLGAEARPGVIEVVCAPGLWDVAGAAYRLTLSSRERTATTRAAVVHRAGDAVTLRAEGMDAALEDLALGSSAVLATLDVIPARGSRWQARMWLAKPDFLSLPAGMRARRHALALMTQQLFVDDVHLHRVAEWILQTSCALAAELRAIGATEAGAPGVPPGRNAPTMHPQSPVQQEEVWEEVPEEDWEEREDAEDDEVQLDPEFFEGGEVPDDRSTTTGGRGRTRVLARLDNYLRTTTRLVDSLFAGPPEAGYKYPQRVGAVRDKGEENGEGELASGGNPTHVYADADRLLVAAADDLHRAGRRIFRVRPTAESVWRVSDTVEVFAAYLYRLELHARYWESCAAEETAGARRELWLRAWSIAGWERGLCRAWMPRARVMSAGPALAEAWHDQDRVARLTVLAAASWALDPAAARVPENILAGIQIVTGGDVAPDGELAQRLRVHAGTLAAQSADRLTAEGILKMLTPVTPGTLSSAATVRSWLPALPLLDNEGFTAGEIENALAAFRSALGPGGRGLADRLASQISLGRYPAGLRHATGRPACSRCSILLPKHVAQALARGVVCESCGAFIIPIAWEDPVCRLVLGWLLEGSAAAARVPSVPALAGVT